MIRVVVVEDQPLVRGGIVLLLKGAGDIEVVGEAADGQSAIDQATQLRPDIVLMDLRMPGMDGIEATRILTGSQGTVRVLVLTTFDDDPDVLGALRAGASGFLTKDSAPTRLTDAVRSVAAGDAWLDPSISGRVLRALQQVPHELAWSPALVDVLTPREQEVLALLAQGLSAADISDRLVLSDATVKTHLHRILMKTGCRDRAQAVVLAYRTGLVAPEPNSVSYRSSNNVSLRQCLTR